MLFETSFIFPAPKYPLGNWQPEDFPYQPVEFRASDGVALYGWLLEHPNPVGWAVYCHGNGENVAMAAAYVSALRNRFRLSILLFDYRGYGRSEGRPDEPGVIADGLAAQQWVAEHYRVRPSDVIVIGRSLGGAIAVAIAAERGARGLVLQSTFHSMVDLAKWYFPMLPLRRYLRNRFENIPRIQRTTCPLLQSHSEDDEVVPWRMGRALFDAAPQTQKTFFSFRGRGHNEGEPAEYAAVFDRFLEQLAPVTPS